MSIIADTPGGPMLFRRRLVKLDQQAEEARERARKAEGEVRKSRRRREEIRQEIVAPLMALAEDNHFAAIIKDSILAGYRNGRNNGNHKRGEARGAPG